MISRNTVKSTRGLGILALGMGALACAHRSTPAASNEGNVAPQLPPPIDAGVVSYIPATPLTSDAGLADAAVPLQREVAPRQDIAGATQPQHDNPRALAMARCQQQERCGFVRQGGKYMMLQQCLTVVLDEQRDHLVKYSCPSSTNANELQNCLEEVRAMDCAHPFVSFDALPSCNTARICRGTNAVIPAP